MTDSDETTASESNRTRDALRRAANVVAIVLLVLVLVPFVVYAVPQTVGADNGYVVLSGSMEPTMSPGDAIVVDDVPTAEIEERDIITFARAGQERPTTHRVVEVVQQDGGVAFRTAGDDNEDPDQQLVTPGEVEGRIPVVAGEPLVIPFIGHVIQFASTQLGFVLLVGVPIGLLLLSELWSLAGQFRSGRDAGPDDEPDATADEGEPERPSGEIDATTMPSAAIDAGVAPFDLDIRPPEDDRSDGTPSGPVVHVDSAAVSGSTASPSDETPSAGAESETRRAADGPATQSDSESTEDEPEGEGVTFTAAELELGLVVLAAFLGYSAWVAVETFEVWAFTVAGSVGAAFLLLSVLYLAGRLGGDSAAEPADEPAADSAERDTDTAVTEAERYALLARLAGARANAESVLEAARSGRPEPSSPATPETPSGTITDPTAPGLTSEQGENDD